MSALVPAPFSAHQINLLAEDLHTFPPLSQRRGREYAANGRVGALQIHPEGFTTEVLGQEVYLVSWTWKKNYWYSNCTCPVAPYCKHAYAAALRFIGQSNSEASGKATDASVAAATAAASGSGRLSAFEKLRSAHDFWARFQHLQTILAPARKNGLAINIHDTTFEEILREPDSDVMSWRLASALTDVLPPDVLPPELVEYRQRDDLKSRFEERGRSLLSNALLGWVEQQRRKADRQVRLVLGLKETQGRVHVTAQVRVTTPRINDEPRNTMQLQTLRNELRRQPEAFSPEAATVLDWACERISDLGGGVYYTGGLDSERRLNGSQLRSLLTRLADSPLVSWSSELDTKLAGHGGIHAGDLLRVGGPVRILPTLVSHDGTPAVELACVFAEHQQHPLHDTLYLRGDAGYTVHPSHVLINGRFHPVMQEPPQELVEQFTRLASLPVPIEERDTVLGTLTAAFPHLQSSVGTHTKLHRLQPVIAMDLRDDDWLQVRAYARNRASWSPSDPIGSDDIVFEYAPSGRWTRLTAAASPSALPEPLADLPARPAEPPVDGPNPAAASAEVAGHIDADSAVDDASQAQSDNDVWFEIPDPELVEPALSWMTSLDLRPGKKGRSAARAPRWSDADVGWWQKITRKIAATFSEVWDQRPISVAFFGTPRARRMLSGEMRVWPKLKIESSGVEWFSVSAEWEAEGMKLSDDDLAALRNSTARFVRISSGWVQRDAAEVHDTAATLLADLGIEPGAGTQRLSVWQLASAKSESLAALHEFGADPETLAAVEHLREQVRSFQGVPVVPRPPGLEGELRPYQLRGVDFLAYTASIGAGSVLADDMGLGKTLQALAWVLHLKDKDPQGGPTLVVCPASVVHNWQRETERFAPGLRILLLTSGKTRHQLRGDIPEHDLVVTNYALLRRDIEAWREVKLRAVIFDEAQQIKNPDAAVTHAAASLQARHRLALTGTPLENRALDLFSIVDVVNPGYLGRRSRFQLRFDRPDAPAHVRVLLAAKLRPILLRRTKREVAPELPERIEEQWDCEMTSGQRQLYLAEVKRSRAMIDKIAGSKGGIAQNKIHILAALTRLRQICCHPRLAGSSEPTSGKFDALFELLEPLLAEGHKVLVFSQFVECIRLLRAELKSRAIPHHVLTGQSTRRAEIVDAFQSDPQPSIFLISLKAGGTGLNLTAASYVVLFDPWWNPAVEAQAIDRTHRIGQDRTVIAYRLITKGTIEEKIYQLQQRKAALVRDILGEDGFARTLTREDLDYLLEEA